MFHNAHWSRFPGGVFNLRINALEWGHSPATFFQPVLANPVFGASFVYQGVPAIAIDHRLVEILQRNGIAMRAKIHGRPGNRWGIYSIVPSYRPRISGADMFCSRRIRHFQRILSHKANLRDFGCWVRDEGSVDGVSARNKDRTIPRQDS